MRPATFSPWRVVSRRTRRSPGQRAMLGRLLHSNGSQLVILLRLVIVGSAFVVQSHVAFRARSPCAPLLSTATNSPTAPILDDIPETFRPLIASSINATVERGADTSNQGHDSFRYEWGTWVNESSLEHLMHEVNRVRLTRSGYDTIKQYDAADLDDGDGVRFRMAGGQDWECFLHVLPEGYIRMERKVTGSWTIIKVLTGLAEIQARTEGGKVRTRREIRGGSDGSLAGGQSSQGDDCIKYVGGPLRAYVGKYGKTILLEVILQPPIGKTNVDVPFEHELPIDDWESILSIAEPEPDFEIIEGVPDSPGNATTNGSENSSTSQLLSMQIGMNFDQVGGLDAQLNAIARRVLASRANPAAARRLGISHVRGILLSGPPGCGKTLLARELSRLLGAREPQIVNGPEILDKFIGEAEKKVRELFAPAEREYRAAGDDSALHIIILDEMDAIARKRGTMTSDTTGVRDSVVNQLLAKLDGVRQAPNILVVGLTNRPELLDPALLRPGRLEVQLRVELPDLPGRRDILRIHTRQMREAGGIADDAVEILEDDGEEGMAALTEHFSGAELAGLVRSAASFALARALESTNDEEEGVVTTNDLKEALKEVKPALGKQDEVLKTRYPLGVSACSASMRRVLRDLERFSSPAPSRMPQVQSMLLVGAGGNGGAGATALAAWAAAGASAGGTADYVRFITSLDVLTEGSGSDEARAAALVDRFAEARELSNPLLVLDDVDQLCAGSSRDGYSSVMVATLRALLRSPPTSASMAKAGGQTESKLADGGKTMHILGTTSRSDAACSVLHDIFEETVVVPLLNDAESVQKLLSDSLPDAVADPRAMADLIVDRLKQVPCKVALRLAERAVTAVGINEGSNYSKISETQLVALDSILNDLTSDGITAADLCEVV